jgi:hypothetical protein
MATYYISLTGNDTTGTGSSINPWRTLYHATSQVNTPGDIIHVNAGNYSESQTSSLAIGVTLEGDGRNVTTITCTVNTLNNGLLELFSGAEGTNGNQHIRGIHFTTAPHTTHFGVSIAARSNVEVYDCRFTNFRLFGCNFSAITYHLGAGEPTVYATGNKFYNNVGYDSAGLYNVDGFLYGRGIMQFGGQDGFEGYGNDLEQPQRISATNYDIGWPIKMANEGWIKNCRIYNNRLVRYRMLAYHGDSENWNFCFEMWNTLGGNQFYNNTCQGAVDIVRNHNTTTEFYSWLFYGNTITQPLITPSPFISYGIELEQGEEDVYVFANVFDKLTTPVVFSPRNNNPRGITIKRIYIDRNLMSNCGTTGDARAVIDFNNIGTPDAENADVTDIYFRHNTVTKAAGANMAHVFRLPVYVGNLCQRFYIDDNILIGDEQGAIVGMPSSRVTNVWARNNMTFQSNKLLEQIIPDDFVTQVPIVGLTTSGNIINVDPLLNSLFVPQAGSQALNGALDGTNIGHTGGEGSGNLPPTANPGSNQALSAGTTTTTLTGAGTDTDGTISGYLWQQISGAPCIIVSPAANTTNITGLTAGVYLFRFTVTDNNNATGYADLTVTVQANLSTGLKLRKRRFKIGN